MSPTLSTRETAQPEAVRAHRQDATQGDVLVVDDQEDSRQLLAHHLASAGYGVRCAASAEEALDSLAQARPALIVLDVIMSGMNGMDLCRQLKSHPATLSIPIILVTALQRRSDRVHGIEAGADEFLSKPVNREELFARVRALMRLSEARRALEQARLDIEVERREHVQRTFERYVAPKLVAAILEGRQDDQLLSRQSRREAVALFADLRGFTRMTELLDADTVVGMLNDFFTVMTDVVYANEGTVFNMAGDNLLVGFGVPLQQDDAPARAVATALAMQQRFATVAADWQQRHGVSAALGVGIDRGMVVVGNVGSPTYMSYTMIGDTVNVAARLVQHAAAGEILVTRPVADAIGNDGEVAGLEQVPSMTLRGKSAPLEVYRVNTVPDRHARN